MFRKSICIISFVALFGMGLATPAQAVDPDLVGHWPFDEGSGTTAFDASGNGNDGIFVGDPQWVVGMYGGALEFNGDDYLDCGNDPSLEIRDAITIAFWFQVEAFQNSWEAFLSKGDSAYRASRGGGSGDGTHLGISGTGAGGGNGWFNGPTIITGGDWHHFAGTYDGSEGRIYVDGVLDASTPASGQINIEPENFWIGNNSQNTSRQLHGLMDDVRLYSRALTEEEIQGVMAGGGAEFPRAAGPTPEDGAMLEATWVSMGWRAGDKAVSHDVYLSDNFDDVNDGAAAAFQGSKVLTDTTLIVGFFGFPLPDGLVPGTTYYWRIDEINDTEPNSPWIGPVWSFWVPPKTAYNQAPAEAATFVATDAELSWTAGFGAQLHTVYFGDDLDTVSNASGGTLTTDTTFDPGPLEKDKTYYWRVDELEAPITHKGNVLSFSTVPNIPIGDPTLIGWWTLDEGTGTTAVDWSGHDNHGELRGDPEWTSGRDGGALDFDGSGDFIFTGKSASDLGIDADNAKSVTAWVYTRAFNNGGIFDMGARSDAQDFSLRTLGSTNNWRTQYWGGANDHDFVLAAQNQWVHLSLVYTGTQSTVYANGVSVSSEARTLATSAANPFQIGAYGWQANFFDGIIDDVRLYNKGLTVEEITEIMRGNIKLAASPSPDLNTIVDIRDISSLSWSAGDAAVSHDVYFGTDRDAVALADNTSAEFQGNQAGTSLSLASLVEFGGGDYYWRIDEVAADGTVTAGAPWKFTVPGQLIVDDFESYNDLAEDDPASNRVYLTWIDGFGTTTNGAVAGNLEVPLMAPGRDSAQAMPVSYDLDGTISEATRTLTSKKDWTEQGVTKLVVWFSGASGNSAERMFVALGNAVVYHSDDAATQDGGWNEWVIDLQEFADQGANLANVGSITLGFGTRNAPVATGGIGTVELDDMGLIP